jgi:hypothetical protein
LKLKKQQDHCQKQQKNCPSNSLKTIKQNASEHKKNGENISKNFFKKHMADVPIAEKAQKSPILT